MSKKNKPPAKAATTARPATPPVIARVEPTPEQSVRLDDAELELEAISEDNGRPDTEGVVEPVGANLEDSLKRVEGLLRDARSHFNKARERETNAKVEEERLNTQRKDQEEALKQRKRDFERDCAAVEKKAKEDLAAAKKKDHEELVVRKADLDKMELDLIARGDACATRESAIQERENSCRVKEADFIEQNTKIIEREYNATQGFLTEKTRILKPLEDELKKLREECDNVSADIVTRRAKDEEDVRIKLAEWANKWAQRDAERTKREAEQRQTLDAEIAKERESKLAALREELKGVRGRADVEWQRERAARVAELETRNAELDKLEQELASKRKKMHIDQQNLRTDQELFAEDKAALNRKVERLVAEGTENLRHETETLRKQLVDARVMRDAYHKELESRRELDRRFGGRAPEQIIGDLATLERERDTLAQQLRERPDIRTADRLADLERQRSMWLEERAILQGDLAKATGELSTRRLAAIELEALKKQKEALEVHKQLLDGAVKELRTRVDELTRQEDHRNPMTALTSLDENEMFQAEVRTTSPLGYATPSLREFAEDLRHRIATGVEGRTLYYAARDVRAFLGGLAMTRLMLLQGISGTGKTSLPLAFANAVGGDIEIVEVQAGWRDRQDLVGYYNAFHRHYYATNFLQAIYRAGTPAYRDRLFMMVLDEINLSRPEQFFADFLSALEQPIESRRLTLVNDPVSNAPKLMVDGRHLPIPPNVWFVGTANHDESTAEFADKTYDRAHVMEMPRKTDDAHFSVVKRGDRKPISYKELDAAFAKATDNHIETVKKATNWLRTAPFATTLSNRFRVGWGNRLEHQLARYLPVIVETGGTVGEAMDHLLVSKVFRKLKDRHDVRANALEELHKQLLNEWDKLDMKNPPERCIDLIENEIAAKQGEESA